MKGCNTLYDAGSFTWKMCFVTFYLMDKVARDPASTSFPNMNVMVVFMYSVFYHDSSEIQWDMNKLQQ